MDTKGLTDGFVKLYLLPNKSSKGKKTAVVKDNLNPVWNEEFAYEKVALEDLRLARVLEVTVLDYDRGSSNDFVGGLRLGPTPNRVGNHKEWIDSNVDEAGHWEEMLTQHDEWVERWHSLRASMDPRAIDLSDISALALVRDEETEEKDPISTSHAGEEQSAEGKEKCSADVVKSEWDQEFRKVNVQQQQPTSKPQEKEEEEEDSKATSEDCKVVSLRQRPAEKPVVEDFGKGGSEEDKDKDEVWPLRRASPVINKPRHQSSSPRLEQKSQQQALGKVDETSNAQQSVNAAIDDASSRNSDNSLVKTAETRKSQSVHHSDSSRKSPSLSPSLSPKTTGPSSHHQYHHTTPPPSSASPLLRQLQLQGSTGTLGSTISFGSMTSTYSAAGGKGDYDITGEVLLGVTHTGHQLEVVVGRVRGLAAAKQGSSSPYVKTYLLPDRNKSTKQKTIVKKKTLNPVYNETIKYDVPLSEVTSRTLCVSVWDWDRFGRNQFLGEVRLPLSSAHLTDSTQHWHTLQDKDESSGIDDFVRGELKLGLMFQPRPTRSTNSDAAGRGTLNIFIKEARDLPVMNSSGRADTVVKCFLLPDHSSVSKRKTGVIKNNLTPVWEEKFGYEGVSLRELLSERVLEVTVWHHDKHGNEFIGGMRMGGAPGRSPHQQKWMDAIGLEVSHWEDMLRQPGKWIEEWHTLRPSMVPREVDLSQTPPPFTIPSLETSSSRPLTSVESCLKPNPPDITLGTTKEPSLSGDVFVAGDAGVSTIASAVPDIQLLAMQQDDILPSPSQQADIPPPLPSQAPPPILAAQQDDDPSASSQPPPPVLATHQDEDLSASSQPPPPVLATQQDEDLSASSQPPPPILATQRDEDSSAFSQPPPTILETQQADVPPSPSQLPPPAILTQEPDINGRDWRDPFEEEPKSKPRDLSLAHRAGLLGLNTTGGSVTSFGSMTSIYSAAGGKGDYDITGEVLCGIHFKNGQLLVHINKARDLAAADSNGYSDPYIKTYLLPDRTKSTKKKTDIKKKTLNPVYNHTIKYKVSQDELSMRTLWLSVWDWDRFGKNQFLGEIRLPLSSIDLSDSTDHWYNLHDKDSSEEDERAHRGELQIAMMFEELSSKKGKTKGTLHVTINQAKDLFNSNSTSKADSFVKCYLLPDKSSSGKRKTRVIKANSDPVWEESFSYEKLSLEELVSERGLEVTVWDFNKGSSNEFIGGLRIGPSPSTGKRKEWMDSIGEELRQWESVVSNPGEWTDVWHTLRTTMDYRNVA